MDPRHRLRRPGWLATPASALAADRVHRRRTITHGFAPPDRRGGRRGCPRRGSSTRSVPVLASVAVYSLRSSRSCVGGIGRGRRCPSGDRLARRSRRGHRHLSVLGWPVAFVASRGSRAEARLLPHRAADASGRRGVRVALVRWRLDLIVGSCTLRRTGSDRPSFYRARQCHPSWVSPDRCSAWSAVGRRSTWPDRSGPGPGQDPR